MATRNHRGAEDCFVAIVSISSPKYLDYINASEANNKHRMKYPTRYSVHMANEDANVQAASVRLYDVDMNDPHSVLVDRSHISPDDRRQVTEVMNALARLRDAEQGLSEASQRYMKLGKTDMKALHFLIVSRHADAIVTPSVIAAHLGISTASTTKLLDRLEAGGHIVRSPHPTDRRALAITITDETKEAAMQTVGLAQARRFNAAARLTAKERATVIRFLDDMIGEISAGSQGWDGVAGA